MLRIIPAIICLVLATTSSRADAPNIVFILADDLGVGELQWYPENTDVSNDTANVNDTFSTPTLFSLAQEGIRLTNFHSVAPTCSPSRAGILTGRYPHEFNIRDYMPEQTGRGLPQGIPTIASGLRDLAGYTTGFFGKWHIGEGRSKLLPVNYGFDESLVRYGNELYEGYMGNVFIEGDDLAGRFVVNPNEHSSETITDRAISFMETAESADTPYLLTLWYRAPHNPLDPPANFPKRTSSYPNYGAWSTWPNSWSELVSTIPELQHLAYLEDHSATVQAKQRAMYIATVAWLDYQIGRVVKRIDELDPGGNTIIIFTSDNGATQKTYAQGDGAVPGKWQPNGELSGEKRYLSQGGINVPFIVRWPAQNYASGTMVSEFVSGLDILPTFLDVAGTRLALDNYPGVSLRGVLSGQTGVPARSEAIVWETPKVKCNWCSATVDLEGGEFDYALWDQFLGRKLLVTHDAPGLPDIGLFDTTGLLSSPLIESAESNLIAAEAPTAEVLEDDYRNWRQQVGSISHVYNLEQSSVGIEDVCLDVSLPTDRVELFADENFAFRDGDFSFQTRVEIQSAPSPQGAIIAQHPDSWSLYVQPGIAPGSLMVSLDLVAKDNSLDMGYPGLPGDTLSLRAEKACPLPCDMNVAFTVLGSQGESSVRLYLDQVAVGEYLAGSDPAVFFEEVYADDDTPLLLGNDVSGTLSFPGKIIDPRFFRMFLESSEVGEIFTQQSFEVCESVCH